MRLSAMLEVRVLLNDDTGSEAVVGVVNIVSSEIMLGIPVVTVMAVVVAGVVAILVVVSGGLWKIEWRCLPVIVIVGAGSAGVDGCCRCRQRY